MGFIIGLFGSISSLLLIPIGFAIGVYIPLVITDTAYQIYNYIGLSNFVDNYLVQQTELVLIDITVSANFC